MQSDIAPLALTKFRAAIILQKGRSAVDIFQNMSRQYFRGERQLGDRMGRGQSKPDCHKKAKSGFRFYSPPNPLFSGVAERPFIKQPRGRDKGHAAQPQKSIGGEAKVRTFTGPGISTCTWLRECCGQVEAEVISCRRSKLHQTSFSQN